MTDIDLFVSHSTKDDAIVSQIHDKLEASALNVWVDHEDGIGAGDPFPKQIQDASNTCLAGLFVMSNSSVESEYCTAEWHRILARGLILYVVLIEKIPLEKFPVRLGTIHYIDLTSDFDTGIEQLINAVKGKRRIEQVEGTTKQRLSITGSFPRSYLDIPLIGRDEQLQKIQQDLKADNRLVAILGFGGLGKTRLASEIAVTTTFRDGVVWQTISPYTSITDLTASIRDHLGLDESHDDDAIWKALAHKQVLVVLDNAEDCRDRPTYAERINQLDLSGGSRLLMTSRYQWREVRSKALNLPFLDKASATSVFEEMLALENPAFPVEDYKDDLVKAGRFHPRLMEYSVSWLNNYPADYVLEILQSLEGQDAQELLDDIVQKTVERVQEQNGGETAISALRRLAVCQGGFTFEAARAIIDEVSALALLKRWNLIDLNEGRYAIDPMVIQVVGIDETAYPAHFDYYYQLARTHDKAQDYFGLDIESANLDVAFEWQLRHDVAKAYWFYNACADFLVNRGRIRKNMNWIQGIEDLLESNISAELKAIVNNSMGNAYSSLSSIENKEDNLYRAIETYQNALIYWTSKSTPFRYARTQNNLGIAYRELASIKNTEVYLRKAIESHQKALKYLTEINLSHDYAITQNNLGTAYRNLAFIENRENNLLKAIQAFKNALMYLSERIRPLEYAMTQNNLGTAYRDLASNKNTRNNLHNAIQAYNKALKYNTEITAPLEYAMTQHNMGIAYKDLASIENAEVNLHKAIESYQNALVYRTAENTPFDYAQTQNTLGNVYRNLASIKNTEDNLQKAIRSYQNALKYYSEETTPLDYAMTQSNLGNGYSQLASIENTEVNLHKAIESHQKALKYWTPETAPFHYATAQNNLGAAYQSLASIENTEVNLHKAIQAFQNTLVYWTPKTDPFYYAMTQNNLGATYQKLASIENAEVNFHKAIEKFQKVLKYWTPKTTPFHYATAQNNLGTAYRDLASIENTEVNLIKAIKAYKRVLKYYDKTNNLINYANIHSNIAYTYQQLAEVKNREDNLNLAIEAYGNAIRLETTGIHYYLRSEAYMLLERYEEALADISKVLEEYPDDEDILQQRDEVLALLKQDD